MWFLLFAIIAVLVFSLVIEILFPRRRGAVFNYRKKEYLLTQPEHDCFNALTRTVGDKYCVFPQIHLASILDHRVRGQRWWAAFRHIDEKSIDFLLCDKERLSPVLAIELDDSTHDRPDRRDRDREVERILKGANLLLLRIQHNYSERDLSQQIEKLIYPPKLD